MRTIVPIVLISAALAAGACSRKEAGPDPTGLAPRMTTDQVVEIMGKPDEIKPAGDGKEIYIYRKQNEYIHVFIVEGRIKSIEHVRRQLRISR